MDILLKGEMDGIEAAEHILARFNIPVIFLTSYSDEKYLERAKITEPFGYLLKPFESRELHIAIQMGLYKHKMEKDLHKAKEAAEASSRVKGHFLRNMSHELRTPLNAIIGFSDLLGMETSGDQKEMCQHIFTSATRLLQLIDNVLDISSLEGTDGYLDFSRMNISSLIKSSLSDIRGMYLNHKISFDLCIPTELEVMADRKRFMQIMHALLSNAVKFTPGGGSVRVTAKQKKDLVEISVGDTGIGIRPEDLERIFNSFEQLDSSLSRRYEGTGLGLALTGKLVELHGGTIWAESKGEGKGSTFRFEIPVHGLPDK